ncbi:hypothetical protein FB451DRAFT_1387223 [Mycena latifolia]|nr:hypothetical protein FB451DRAFT_1387223 [Mycena latifolia]
MGQALVHVLLTLAPPLGNWLTGGNHLKDALLLLLIFYLHQLIEVPWRLYHAARAPPLSPRRRRPAHTRRRVRRVRARSLPPPPVPRRALARRAPPPLCPLLPRIRILEHGAALVILRHRLSALLCPSGRCASSYRASPRARTHSTRSSCARALLGIEGSRGVEALRTRLAGFDALAPLEKDAGRAAPEDVLGRRGGRNGQDGGRNDLEHEHGVPPRAAEGAEPLAGEFTSLSLSLSAPPPLPPPLPSPLPAFTVGPAPGIPRRAGGLESIVEDASASVSSSTSTSASTSASAPPPARAHAPTLQLLVLLRRCAALAVDARERCAAPRRRGRRTAAAVCNPTLLSSSLPTAYSIIASPLLPPSSFLLLVQLSLISPAFLLSYSHSFSHTDIPSLLPSRLLHRTVSHYRIMVPRRIPYSLFCKIL